MNPERHPLGGLEHEIAVLVRRHRAASGQLGRGSHPDLTAAAYGLLIWLDDHGPHRPTDLAGHAGVTFAQGRGGTGARSLIAP
jgi:hypothetical protein